MPLGLGRAGLEDPRLRRALDSILNTDLWVSASGGLEVTSGSLAIKLATPTFLTTTSSGLVVTVGDGIAISSGTLVLDFSALDTTDTSAGAADLVSLHDGAQKKITFANFEASINHDNLTGFVANEHIDHTSVTLTAGEGITGGGDISANRSFALDFSDLSTTDTSVGATDLLSIHDGAQKKITFANFEAAIDHDALTNFVANEHIDHTSVTLTAGEGITGGGDISANRSFALDFSDLSTSDTSVGATDLVSIHDGAQKKITFANFEAAIDHDALTNFVANEHVDHTSVTITVSGVSNEISVAEGAQDISASRTFTVGIADDPIIPGTGGIEIPQGTTAQRVANEGVLRVNTSSGTTEIYRGGAWVDLESSSGVSDGDKGDITVSSSGTVWTIDDEAVTLAKMAHMATDSFLGRDTAGTGDVEVLSASTARTILNVEDGADVTDATNVNAAGATMNTDTDVSGNSWVLDENDFSSNSATKVPTQQSVRAYSEHAVVDLEGGRLSLESGVSVSTSDQASKTTIYYTEHIHDRIGLYNTTDAVWEPFTFTEASLATTGFTADVPHDIFAYDSSGTLTLEAVAWTNTSTRATELATQDGVKVKSGSAGRRYVGTVDVDSSKQAHLTTTKCSIWNVANRVHRALVRQETTASWTYTTATFRQANGSTSNHLDTVRGLDEDAITVQCSCGSANTDGAILRATGIGLNSSSSDSSQLRTPIQNTNDLIAFNHSWYSGLPGIGRVEIVWLEWSQASGTTTFHGVNASWQLQSGIFANFLY